MENLLQHSLLLFLGIILFFITNLIGKYSRSFGYSEIKFDISNDELAGFNLVIRLLTPVIFIILISSVFYYFNLDSFTREIYISVMYSYFFRITWNILHNRISLINWYAQVSYALLATFFSYLAYKHLIIPKITLFPNLETLGNELWILIIIFLYKIFNEIKFPVKFKEKRVDNYIRKRYTKFKIKFGSEVNQQIDAQFKDLLEKVEVLKSDNLIFNENKYLNYILIPIFSTFCRQLITDITYSIMINEDFNRPLLFRKIENLSCLLFRRMHSQGIMQFQSADYISDKESIRMAIDKFYANLFITLKTNNSRIWVYQLVDNIFRDYNNSDHYIDSTNIIFNLLKNHEKFEEFEIFLNDLTLIGFEEEVGE